MLEEVRACRAGGEDEAGRHQVQVVAGLLFCGKECGFSFQTVGRHCRLLHREVARSDLCFREMYVIGVSS